MATRGKGWGTGEDCLRREFAQLVANHVLRNDHVVVNLAIVNLKLETDKVGQDGCGPGLGSYRYNLLSRLWSNDWKSG